MTHLRFGHQFLQLQLELIQTRRLRLLLQQILPANLQTRDGGFSNVQFLRRPAGGPGESVLNVHSAIQKLFWSLDNGLHHICIL